MVTTKDSRAGTLKSRERLNFKLVMIYAVLYLMALGAIFFVSPLAVAGWLVLTYLSSAFGVSLIYHRLISHNMFTPKPWLYKALALLGVLTWAGAPITWSIYHRCHHRFVDAEGDPHTPVRGALWSIFLYSLYDNPNGANLRRGFVEAKDLRQNPFLVFLQRHYFTINVSVLAAAFGVFFMMNRLDLFFWWFPLRIVAFFLYSNVFFVLVPHKFWVKNRKNEPHLPDIQNSHTVAMLTGGDGYHRNHHLHMWSPNFGLQPGQLDLSYLVIRLLCKMKLATVNRRLSQRMELLRKEYARKEQIRVQYPSLKTDIFQTKLRDLEERVLALHSEADLSRIQKAS